MQIMKKTVSLCLLISLTLTLLAGCGNTETAGAQLNDGEEAETTEIAVCIASEPETIDPTLNSTTDASTYILHCFEGLMKFEPGADGEAQVVEGQAESYEVSEDGKTYTFHLREGIKWSDGEPVTAEDFVYAWRRLVNPETEADYAYSLNCIENAEEIGEGELPATELGVRALDERTLQVKLVAPTPYFISLCANAHMVPLREDIVEDNDSWTFDPRSYICNGAYTMTKWRHDDCIIMEKNPNYYGAGSVTTERITWRLMNDTEKILASFQNGSLDMINQSPVNAMEQLLANGTMKVLPRLGTYCVIFNTEEEPFDDPLVRMAFNLVINRNEICESVEQNCTKPATAWVPTGINNGADGDFREDGGDYYSVDPQDYEKNCELARELLAMAGYPNGEGFPIVEYLYNIMDTHQKIYEALEHMWSSQLGVTVTGSNQDWNVFVTTRAKGDYQTARHGWTADFNDAINFLDLFTTNNIGGTNYAQWSNEAYDRYIAEAVKEADVQKRQELLHKAEDLLMEEAVVAPLYFYVDQYCLQSDVTGMYHSSLGYYFFKYCVRE